MSSMVVYEIVQTIETSDMLSGPDSTVRFRLDIARFLSGGEGYIVNAWMIELFSVQPSCQREGTAANLLYEINDLGLGFEEIRADSCEAAREAALQLVSRLARPAGAGED